MTKNNIVKNISHIFTAILLLISIPVENIKAQHHVLFSMEKIDDNTYIDATEINVGSWLSYYTWILIHEGYINAQKVLPDSTKTEARVWDYLNKKSGDYISTEARYTGQPIGYFKKMTKARYVLDKGNGANGFDIYNLPIVGVSYAQVVDFCKWRTKINGKGKYIFRLPTAKEWVSYCKTHIDSSDKTICMTDSITDNCNCAIYNYYRKDCQSGEITSHIYPIGCFICDKNYVSDMFGNVSEMVLEEGKAKGGNYTLYASQCNMDSVQIYTKPEKWLGFRCIAIQTNEEVVLETNMYKPKKVCMIDTLNSKHGVYLDKRDGNLYPTIIIGHNKWFAKNLVFKPQEGKYWAYSNNEKSIEELGYLYSWEVATDVCPDGWELPTKKDFEELIDNYGDSTYIELRPGGSSGFCSAKSASKYGMNLILSENTATYWSTTERKKRYAWGLSIGGINNTVGVYGSFSKNSGLPVRCIKRQ